MTRLLATIVLLASALPGIAQKAATPDDRISDQVRMRLAVDQDVKGGAFDVTVKDGVVTIKGRVDTDKGKSRATKLAKKVKGVKEVDNELIVGPPK
ncbi:MAG: BON domain-containing protein [Acidobacteriaceae bacterium]|nr:BON domain-containing protein [Acidobacteriaceae bacterium]MBV9766998.1 BON domain-containing protein [Acidobacteriaceae bacterium]